MKETGVAVVIIPAGRLAWVTCMHMHWHTVQSQVVCSEIRMEGMCYVYLDASPPPSLSLPLTIGGG